MLIRYKKPFAKGFLLLASFVVMAVVMLMPIFKGHNGEKLTSLQFADAVFNSLSKGSSDFFAEVTDSVGAVQGQNVDLSAAFVRPGLASLARQELLQAGLAANDVDGAVSFHGDLGLALSAAVADARELFNNNGPAVAEKYGCANPLDVSHAWWHLLRPCVKELQKAGRVADAAVVDMVIKKAIEPANNFYGLPAAKVADNILLILGMLAFYVLYAVWYGFGIYNLFDGLGLMGKHGAARG